MYTAVKRRAPDAEKRCQRDQKRLTRYEWNEEAALLAENYRRGEEGTTYVNNDENGTLIV